MSLIIILIAVVAVYGLTAYYIHKKNLFQDHISFYGPLLAIKSKKVGFFDCFVRFSRFFRIYGTIGAVMVGVLSIMMVTLLILSFQITIRNPPEPTGPYELQNLLAIPGINDYIPLTLAVIIALVVAIVVHEFGHAILCRIEKIRLDSIGLLFAVIPIGAFVEPNEDDVENTKGMPKIRMYGAGITNNILIGFICFILMFGLLNFAVPVSTPLVMGIYANSPAMAAGLSPDSIIKEINGVPIDSREAVAAAMEDTKPGDIAAISVLELGRENTYEVNLGEWPDFQDGIERSSGFIGVSYYDSNSVKNTLSALGATPLGMLYLMALPINIIFIGGDWRYLEVLVIDTIHQSAWDVPFPGYWMMIQILFWCGWFNLAVGIFNALPLIPLDGGYILKESVERALENRKMKKYSNNIVWTISWIVLFLLISIFMIPMIAHF